MKYLLLFFLSLTLLVRADIHDISQRDIKDIKYLFERLILVHDFAYTIFGTKPMSMADMCFDVPSDLPFHKRLKARFKIMRTKKSLNAWYYNKKEFVFKDFIFLDKEEDIFDCLVLVLINKKSLMDVLHAHELIFKEELGDSFTPELFLEKLEKRETSLAESIHNSRRLLGIMLGYGARNATLFQERLNLLTEIERREKEGFHKDNELIKKLNEIKENTKCFNELDTNPIIPPLYFLADTSHPETIKLQKQYDSDRKKIEAMMQKSNFMNMVLERLIGTERGVNIAA